MSDQYDDQARELSEKILMDQPCELDVGMLARALREADQRGYARGVEAAAKMADDNWEDGESKARAIRQLLAPEREGKRGG